MPDQPADFPWVLFALQGQAFAINACHVREMLQAPRPTTIPESSPETRGVLNLRGQIALLLDTRIRLGLPSVVEENTALIDLLKTREQDHVAWITEVELPP